MQLLFFLDLRLRARGNRDNMDGWVDEREGMSAVEQSKLDDNVLPI
jgi:hypothetical protein